MMTRLLATLLFAALLLPAKQSFAEDAAVRERLKKAGVVLTETKGVVTGAAIKDTAAMTDEDFAALGTLKDVKNLQISGDKLNDQTLGLLTGMTALEDLQTNQAQFTDAGLAQFKKFPNLKQIKFFHTSLRRKDFTGSGFAALADMPSLQRLTVAGCPFNDEGMAAVGKLTQLENFRTWHTYQTEAGNAYLKSLTNLKSLHLGQRLRQYNGAPNPLSASDKTIDVLAEMKSLDTLQLGEMRCTADMLAKLKALPNLKRLTLDRVDISADDVAKLKAALPNVVVEWKPLTDEDRATLDRLLKP